LIDVSSESLAVRHVEAVTRANDPTRTAAKQASRKAGKHNKICIEAPSATMAASAPAPAFMKAGS
jgi:hypothetical protein